MRPVRDGKPFVKLALLPAPRRYGHSIGQNANPVAAPLDAPHQIEVFHQRNRDKPANFAKVRVHHKNRLIAVRQPRQAITPRCGSFNQSERRARTVETQCKGSRRIDGIGEYPLESTPGVGGQHGIRMKKNQAFASRALRAGVRLRTASAGRTERKHLRMRNMTNCASLCIAIYHNHFADLRRGIPEQRLQTGIDPLGFMQRRNNTRKQISGVFRHFRARLRRRRGRAG